MHQSRRLPVAGATFAKFSQNLRGATDHPGLIIACSKHGDSPLRSRPPPAHRRPVRSGGAELWRVRDVDAAGRPVKDRRDTDLRAHNVVRCAEWATGGRFQGACDSHLKREAAGKGVVGREHHRARSHSASWSVADPLDGWRRQETEHVRLTHDEVRGSQPHALFIVIIVIVVVICGRRGSKKFRNRNGPFTRRGQLNGRSGSVGVHNGQPRETVFLINRRPAIARYAAQGRDGAGRCPAD